MSNWNNIEERQHINISEKTYQTLLFDIERYHLTSLSSITNIIIENGCLTLPANPMIYLKEQEVMYQNIFLMIFTTLLRIISLTILKIKR